MTRTAGGARAEGIRSAPFVLRWGREHLALFLWLTGICLLGISLPTGAIEAPSELQRDLRESREFQSELNKSLESHVRLLSRKSALLAKQQQNVDLPMVSPEQLRAARQAVDAVQGRIETLEDRAAHWRLELRWLRRGVAEQAAANRNATPAAQASDELSQADLFQELLVVKSGLLKTLEELIEYHRRELDLAREELVWLQRRIDLDQVEAAAARVADPRVGLVQRVIGGLNREAIRLSNDAETLNLDEVDNEVLRELLMSLADDATLRGNLRQTDLELMRMQGILRADKSLLQDPSMPPNVIAQAVDELDAIAAWLTASVAAVGKQRDSLTERLAVMNDRKDDEFGSLWMGAAERAAQMMHLMEFQSRELEVWRVQVGNVRMELDEGLQKARQRALVEHRPLSLALEDWGRMLANLFTLPQRVFFDLRQALWEVGSRLASVRVHGWILILVTSVLTGLVAFVLRGMLRRPASEAESGLGTSLASALKVVLFWSVPIAAWLALGRAAALPVTTVQRGLLLLSIWPCAQFILRFAGGALEESRLELAARPEAARLRRRLRWTLGLVCTAIVFAVFARWVDLPPNSSDLLERIAFLLLGLAAVKMLRIRKELAAFARSPRGLLAHVAALLAAGVFVCALAGLIGYANLAWVALLHLFWLVFIGGTLIAALAAIHAAACGLSRRFEDRHLGFGSACLYGMLRPLQLVLSAGLVVAAVFALFSILTWGQPSPVMTMFAGVAGGGELNVAAILGSEWGQRVSSALVQVLIAILLAYMVWAIAKHAMRPYMPDEDEGPALPGEDMAGGTGASRISTLMPLLSKFLLITVATITVMVVLSALGVNIGPLLAGAGVVGLAVGFGAQTLVRDVISGIFFLTDDAFRRGEYIDIGSVMGTVEHISVRSLQLRHHNGPVHTVPYGEIQHVTNYSRDWAIMKFELRIPFEADLKKVQKIIKDLGQRMMQDEELGRLMLQPLKSQGVNRMDDSALIVRCKFTTVPGQQFYVRRVAYGAIQKAFEKEGIHFAPRRVIVESGGGPAAASAAAAAAAAAASGGDGPGEAAANDRG